MVQAPGYSKIVTRPMAFSIMWDRFHKGEYMTWEELQADLNQMFRNAMTYNRPETVFHKQASLSAPVACSPNTCLDLRILEGLWREPSEAKTALGLLNPPQSCRKASFQSAGNCILPVC